MYNIQTLNKISKKGLSVHDANYVCADEMENPDGIILRSFKMHDMELPKSLRAVARAGAGVNNIPIEKCTEQGIVVFNTPGANANAVKELVLAGLAAILTRAVDIQRTASTDAARIADTGNAVIAAAVRRIVAAGEAFAVIREHGMMAQDDALEILDHSGLTGHFAGNLKGLSASSGDGDSIKGDVHAAHFGGKRLRQIKVLEGSVVGGYCNLVLIHIESFLIGRPYARRWSVF